MNTERIRVVGAAVVDDLSGPRTLLAARRTAPAELAGGWELPGGKIDPRETDASALHRELREELGVRVELGEEIPGPLDGGWPLGDTYVMHVYFVTVVEGEPRPLEDHDALRVLTKAQLEEVAWLPDDRPVVHAIAALLQA